jgi:hypothetical protein
VPQEKRKIPGPDGKLIDATPVNFQIGVEPFSEYVLEDGSLLRLKPVMVEVLRVDGIYDGEGNPVYVSRTQNVVVVNAPEALKRRPKS